MTHTSTFATDLSEVLRGLAALAWPAVALTALLLFREQLAAAFERILSVQGPGFKVNLARQLDQLKESTEAASESLLPKSLEPDSSVGAEAVTEEEDRVDEILEEASRSPKTALISLAVEIERKSREVLLGQGQADVDSPRRPLRQQLERLELSPQTRAAAAEFNRVRNVIVHGHRATDADALRAVDLGVGLLRAIEQIPHSVNYVVAPAADTYADAGANTIHPFKAVVLRSVSPNHEDQRVYPVSRTDLPVGEPVTWEWNMQRIYPEAWYRDPLTNEVEYGWTQAAEFAGRPIHDS